MQVTKKSEGRLARGIDGAKGRQWGELLAQAIDGSGNYHHKAWTAGKMADMKHGQRTVIGHREKKLVLMPLAGCFVIKKASKLESAGHIQISLPSLPS